MSTIEHEDQIEGRESGLLLRTFESTDMHVEGRTVDVRVVPFNEVARVQDDWDPKPYEEQWMPGVFDHQLRAANRIRANVDHKQHLIDTVGHGLSLRSERDGYHLSVEIHVLVGDIHVLRGTFELCQQAYQRALSLNQQPFHRPVLNVKIGTAYTWAGDARGMDYLKAAFQEADPHTPSPV